MNTVVEPQLSQVMTDKDLQHQGGLCHVTAVHKSYCTTDTGPKIMISQPGANMCGCRVV